MNIDTVIGLNAPNDVDIYLSLEDVAFARTCTDRYDNKYTYLHMKSGEVVKVCGNAYHILGLKDRNNKND